MNNLIFKKNSLTNKNKNNSKWQDLVNIHAHTCSFFFIILWNEQNWDVLKGNISLECNIFLNKIFIKQLFQTFHVTKYNDFLLKKMSICFQFHIIIIDILLVYCIQLANCLTRNKDKKK